MTDERRNADTVAEMRGYLDRHLAQWGEHLAVHVDVGDMEDWIAALDQSRAHGAADRARLTALGAWDDEQHRFYHDAALTPGSVGWETQYAKQAVLWGRLLRLLEDQREAAHRPADVGE